MNDNCLEGQGWDGATQSMGGHCLEARARVGLGISEYPWCEMVWSKYYTSRKRFEHSQWEMTL